MSVSAPEKRAYRLAEKKAAAKVAETAQRLVDARGFAELYMARVMLEQAIRGLVLLADGSKRDTAA